MFLSKYPQTSNFHILAKQNNHSSNADHHVLFIYTESPISCKDVSKYQSTLRWRLALWFEYISTNTAESYFILFSIESSWNS
ncbi:unnamed protein product [Schistosoma bovis]|nr:unnamed protein product [Schistosoma bovis]